MEDPRADRAPDGRNRPSGVGPPQPSDVHNSVLSELRTDELLEQLVEQQQRIGATQRALSRRRRRVILITLVTVLTTSILVAVGYGFI